MMHDLHEVLIHSRAADRTGVSKTSEVYWATLMFAPAKNRYIALHQYGDDIWFLRVWANSARTAMGEYNRLKKRYLMADRDDRSAEFYILTHGMTGPDKRRIKIPERKLDAAELHLNYGDDFAPWHAELMNLIQTRQTGITILQGPPGTGKTSYLRHLLFETQKTHRFYYLPMSVYPMLVAPTSVDFWIGENEATECLTKVVVIEDAEALLMRRDNGNQESVSNLLNIADGFLGDFLKLHVICTINAPVEKLDPAVTRPGRLIASRQFRRLTANEAKRLARVKDLKLEPRADYSLAEIYNRSAARPDGFNDRVLGFSSQ
jgi:ATPase family associated with various cellular activities (AAA)